MIWGIPFKQVQPPSDMMVRKDQVAIGLKMSVVGPFEDKDEPSVIRVLFTLAERPDAVWIYDNEPTIENARATVKSGRPLGSMRGARRLYTWNQDLGRPQLKVTQ